MLLTISDIMVQPCFKIQFPSATFCERCQYCILAPQWKWWIEGPAQQWAFIILYLHMLLFQKVFFCLEITMSSLDIPFLGFFLLLFLQCFRLIMVQWTLTDYWVWPIKKIYLQCIIKLKFQPLQIGLTTLFNILSLFKIVSAVSCIYPLNPGYVVFRRDYRYLVITYNDVNFGSLG